MEMVVENVSFSKTLVSEHFGFLVVFGGPGGFKNLREACGIRFHLSWYLYAFMVPSYDQKTKTIKNKMLS